MEKKTKTKRNIRNMGGNESAEQKITVSCEISVILSRMQVLLFKFRNGDANVKEFKANMEIDTEEIRDILEDM